MKIFNWIIPTSKPEVNDEVSRMAAYLGKYFTPAQRVQILDGVTRVVLDDLERSRGKAHAEEVECINAIRLIKMRKKYE